jgi:uncharacterized protein YdbL (DUF1318 family)
MLISVASDNLRLSIGQWSFEDLQAQNLQFYLTITTKGLGLIAYADSVILAAPIGIITDNSIQENMKKRHNSLKPYYVSGAVGLTDNGLITVHDAKAISLKDRNKVKGLVADENKDRNALYAEIARANGHPEWKADIQSTFARRWVKKAAKGWWYQSGGNWQTK